MERLSIIFILLLFSGCSSLEIMMAKPYEDIEPDTSANINTDKEYASVWDRIHESSAFNDYSIDQNTLVYIENFTKNKKHLDQLIGNGEYFIFEVLEEIDKYNLPREYALLPYIESNYDPFSISSSGAVGLWQFMPATARIYKLEKNWWLENRHDPILSTKAAIKYLAYLYNRFDNDPILTLAAYNAGPTYLERQINITRRSGKDPNFQNLKLPNQTVNYIPKFLAIRELILNPDKYGLVLPNFPDKKVIDLVEINGQIEMLAFSEFIDIKPEFLYQLNAGYTKWATPPNLKTQLYVPIEKKDFIDANKGLFLKNHNIKWITHTVKRGDSLWKLANKYDVRLEDLITVNSKNNNSLLKTNEVLLIPLVGPDEAVFIPYQVHIVSEGDTLWSLGEKYNLRPQDIAANNQIAINSVLKIGMNLNIGTKNIYRTINSKKRTILYSVKQGDSLYRISEMFNLKIIDIIKLNDLPDASIKPGQVLKLVIRAI